jgi:hypothetical protein
MLLPPPALACCHPLIIFIGILWYGKIPGMGGVDGVEFLIIMAPIYHCSTAAWGYLDVLRGGWMDGMG